MEKGGYVNILSSKGKRLYIGVTAQLQIRMKQHKSKTNPNSFTARYNIHSLVSYQEFQFISEAIARESAIKNLSRLDKLRLIVALNPTWQDLCAPWGKPTIPFDESQRTRPITF